MKQCKELEVVELMIRLYCRKKHQCKDGLCTECNELLEYVKFRRSKCPWGDKKPFCSNCKIHCYKPEMREKIKEVMRFSGAANDFLSPRNRAEPLNRNQKAEERTKKRGAKKQCSIKNS